MNNFFGFSEDSFLGNIFNSLNLIFSNDSFNSFIESFSFANGNSPFVIFGFLFVFIIFIKLINLFLFNLNKAENEIDLSFLFNSAFKAIIISFLLIFLFTKKDYYYVSINHNNNTFKIASEPINSYRFFGEPFALFSSIRYATISTENSPVLSLGASFDLFGWKNGQLQGFTTRMFTLPGISSYFLPEFLLNFNLSEYSVHDLYSSALYYIHSKKLVNEIPKKSDSIHKALWADHVDKVLRTRNIFLSNSCSFSNSETFETNIKKSISPYKNFFKTNVGTSGGSDDAISEFESAYNIFKKDNVDNSVKLSEQYSRSINSLSFNETNLKTLLESTLINNTNDDTKHKNIANVFKEMDLKREETIDKIFDLTTIPLSDSSTSSTSVNSEDKYYKAGIFLFSNLILQQEYDLTMIYKVLSNSNKIINEEVSNNNYSEKTINYILGNLNRTFVKNDNQKPTPDIMFINFLRIGFTHAFSSFEQIFGVEKISKNWSNYTNISKDLAYINSPLIGNWDNNIFGYNAGSSVSANKLGLYNSLLISNKITDLESTLIETYKKSNKKVNDHYFLSNSNGNMLLTVGIQTQSQNGKLESHTKDLEKTWGINGTSNKAIELEESQTALANYKNSLEVLKNDSELAEKISKLSLFSEHIENSISTINGIGSLSPINSFVVNNFTDNSTLDNNSEDLVEIFFPNIPATSTEAKTIYKNMIQNTLFKIDNFKIFQYFAQTSEVDFFKYYMLNTRNPNGFFPQFSIELNSPYSKHFTDSYLFRHNVLLLDENQKDITNNHSSSTVKYIFPEIFSSSIDATGKKVSKSFMIKDTSDINYCQDKDCTYKSFTGSNIFLNYNNLNVLKMEKMKVNKIISSLEHLLSKTKFENDTTDIYNLDAYDRYKLDLAYKYKFYNKYLKLLNSMSYSTNSLLEFKNTESFNNLVDLLNFVSYYNDLAAQPNKINLSFIKSSFGDQFTNKAYEITSDLGNLIGITQEKKTFDISNYKPFLNSTNLFTFIIEDIEKIKLYSKIYNLFKEEFVNFNLNAEKLGTFYELFLAKKNLNNLNGIKDYTKYIGVFPQYKDSAAMIADKANNSIDKNLLVNISNPANDLIDNKNLNLENLVKVTSSSDCDKLIDNNIMSTNDSNTITKIAAGEALKSCLKRSRISQKYNFSIALNNHNQINNSWFNHLPKGKESYLRDIINFIDSYEVIDSLLNLSLELISLSSDLLTKPIDNSGEDISFDSDTNYKYDLEKLLLNSNKYCSTTMGVIKSEVNKNILWDISIGEFAMGATNFSPNLTFKKHHPSETVSNSKVTSSFQEYLFEEKIIALFTESVVGQVGYSILEVAKSFAENITNMMENSKEISGKIGNFFFSSIMTLSLFLIVAVAIFFSSKAIINLIIFYFIFLFGLLFNLILPVFLSIFNIFRFLLLSSDLDQNKEFYTNVFKRLEKIIFNSFKYGFILFLLFNTFTALSYILVSLFLGLFEQSFLINSVAIYHIYSASFFLYLILGLISFITLILGTQLNKIMNHLSKAVF